MPTSVKREPLNRPPSCTSRKRCLKKRNHVVSQPTDLSIGPTSQNRSRLPVVWMTGRPSASSKLSGYIYIKKKKIEKKIFFGEIRSHQHFNQRFPHFTSARLPFHLYIPWLALGLVAVTLYARGLASSILEKGARRMRGD